MSQGEGGGRPEIPIDENELEKLAMMQCTVEEIAHFFNCSKDTIERRFAAVIEKGRAVGRMSMKRQLFTKMQKGDLGAMVWWGKNYAGMSDKVEQRQTVTVQQEIEYKTAWGSTREVNEMNEPERLLNESNSSEDE